MAKLKGIVQLDGTIDGLNFYKLNGKIVARRAGGGFNGQAIRTQPNMQRVRENGSEFGHCSRVNKVFRQALHPFYSGHRFSFFHRHLMSLFTSLKNLDSVNIRGERRVHEGIATAEGKRLMQHFRFTPECDPLIVLPFDIAVDWSTHSCSITGISIKQVPFITGATHVEVQFGLLDFDFESLEYRVHMAASEFLDRGFTGTQLTLTPTAVPGVFGTRVAVLGVRYYQDISGQLYPMKGQDSVGIGVV